MERKNKPSSYIEPMPRKNFLQLMKEFKALGGKYVADDISEQYLNSKGVEAITLNETTILFRKRPTRAAVYEELYHVKQYRDGKIDGTQEVAIVCEIEAQEYLLENSATLELTELEIIQTEKALAYYKEELKLLKGDDYVWQSVMY